MKHIHRYNESAGQGWRQVTEQEIDRRMSKERADTFTKEEVKAILDLVAKTGRHVGIVEYDIRTERLQPGLFHSRRTPLRVLRAHEYAPDWPIRWKRAFTHPRVPSNYIYIADFGLSSEEEQSSVYVDIYKSADDYYFLDIVAHTNAYYVCDGLDGLKSLLGHFFEQRKARP